MRVVVRTAGSTEIGLGHVMRCVALAQAVRAADITTVFVVDRDPVVDAVLNRYGLECTEPNQAQGRSWLDAIHPGDVVVYDGYQFGAADHTSAREAGAVVVAIDDLGAGSFPVDLLVNTNPVPGPDYSMLPGTRLLLGPQYALIREEFIGRNRSNASCNGTLLVTLGGADAGELTSRALEIVAGHSPFVKTVLLRGPVSRSAVPAVHGLEVVTDPSDVAAVFASADAAVATAGVTTWELLCLGVPTALIQVADNQRHVVRAATDLGAALYVGRGEELEQRLGPVLHDLGDAGLRRELTERGRELIDGRGAERVVMAMKAAVSRLGDPS